MSEWIKECHKDSKQSEKRKSEEAGSVSPSSDKIDSLVSDKKVAEPVGTQRSGEYLVQFWRQFGDSIDGCSASLGFISWDAMGIFILHAHILRMVSCLREANTPKTDQKECSETTTQGFVRHVSPARDPYAVIDVLVCR